LEKGITAGVTCLSAYDQALVERGSITFWISEDFAKTWRYAGEKQRGSQYDYSDQAIRMMLTIKEVFRLTNRRTEGFVRSIFKLMRICLPVPDHTTLSKRGKGLKVDLPKKTQGSLNIVMDSTGLKIYGEGEWKVRMHGASKRRTWRKLHVRANPEDGEIQAVLLRSLAETAMFRLKTIFGDQLSTRLIETQTTQALIRCAALNQMTHLGMPQSDPVA